MKDEEFYKNLGVVLRAEREKRNLSQQEIADKLGVSKMLVSNWESGQRRMYVATLKKYCEIFDISISCVLDQC